MFIAINICIPIVLYCTFIAYYSIKNNKKLKSPTLSLFNVFPIVLLNLLIIVPISIIIWSMCKQWQVLTFNIIDMFLIVPTVFCISILFGLLHFIMHKIPYAFTHWHMLHHKAIVTKACDALYVHPIEFIACIIFPTLFSVYMFNLSYFAYLIVLTISIHENVVGHVSIKDYMSEHNYHHLYYCYNYDSYPYILGKYILKNYMKILRQI